MRMIRHPLLSVRVLIWWKARLKTKEGGEHELGVHSLEDFQEKTTSNTKNNNLGAFSVTEKYLLDVCWIPNQNQIIKSN